LSDRQKFDRLPLCLLFKDRVVTAKELRNRRPKSLGWWAVDQKCSDLPDEHEIKQGMDRSPIEYGASLLDHTFEVPLLLYYRAALNELRYAAGKALTARVAMA
jgi:hypothetical protein